MSQSSRTPAQERLNRLRNSLALNQKVDTIKDSTQVLVPSEPLKRYDTLSSNTIKTTLSDRITNYARSNALLPKEPSITQRSSGNSIFSEVALNSMSKLSGRLNNNARTTNNSPKGVNITSQPEQSSNYPEVVSNKLSDRFSNNKRSRNTNALISPQPQPQESPDCTIISEVSHNSLVKLSERFGNNNRSKNILPNDVQTTSQPSHEMSNVFSEALYNNLGKLTDRFRNNNKNVPTDVQISPPTQPSSGLSIFSGVGHTNLGDISDTSPFRCFQKLTEFKRLTQQGNGSSSTNDWPSNHSDIGDIEMLSSSPSPELDVIPNNSVMWNTLSIPLLPANKQDLVNPVNLNSNVWNTTTIPGHSDINSEEKKLQLETSNPTNGTKKRKHVQPNKNSFQYKLQKLIADEKVNKYVQKQKGPDLVSSSTSPEDEVSQNGRVVCSTLPVSRQSGSKQQQVEQRKRPHVNDVHSCEQKQRKMDIVNPTEPNNNLIVGPAQKRKNNSQNGETNEKRVKTESSSSKPAVLPYKIPKTKQTKPGNVVIPVETSSINIQATKTKGKAFDRLQRLRNNLDLLNKAKKGLPVILQPPLPPPPAPFDLRKINVNFTSCDLDTGAVVADVLQNRAANCAKTKITPNTTTHAIPKLDMSNIRAGAILIVLDTNVLIGNLDGLERFLQAFVNIHDDYFVFTVPYIVNQELDRLSKKFGKLAESAQKGNRWINQCLSGNHAHLRGQSVRDHEQRLITISNDDDHIVNCCLQVKQTHRLLLLTNDINLRNKALSSLVYAVNFEKFDNDFATEIRRKFKNEA